MELSDLESIIVSGRTRDRFSPVFGQNTDVAKSFLRELPRIRNDLFHFRRALAVDDYERLAATRNWLFMKIDVAEATS